MMPCCALSATGDECWRAHDHARGDRQRAGRLRLRDRPAVAGIGHVDQALAARTDRVEQRVVAEARDLDADLLGGPDHQGALGHGDLDVVDRQRDRLDRRVVGRRRSAVGLSMRSCRRSSRANRRGLASGSNGQPPCVRCSRYSSRKYWIDDVIGDVAPSPSAQNERPRMLSHRSTRVSRSASSTLARSRAARASARATRCLRGRACTCRRTRACRTPSSGARRGRTQVVSSKICSARVPSIEPASPIASKSSGTSRCSAVRIGVDEPPGVQNFSSWPSRMPPARSSSSRSVMPSGASY